MDIWTKHFATFDNAVKFFEIINKVENMKLRWTDFIDEPKRKRWATKQTKKCNGFCKNLNNPSIYVNGTFLKPIKFLFSS